MKLALRGETLAELTPEELTGVAGGGVLPTTPVDACLGALVETLQATRCFCP